MWGPMLEALALCPTQVVYSLPQLNLLEKSVHAQSVSNQRSDIALHDRQHLPLDLPRNFRDEPFIPAEVPQASKAGKRLVGKRERSSPPLSAALAEKPSSRGVEAERAGGKPSA